MKRSLKAAAVILSLGALLCLAPDAHAQRVGAPRRVSLVSNARVAAADAGPGALYVTVGGREKKAADAAFKSWVIQGGRKVVYSGPDGAGGYEREGQSLRVYDATTGAHRKVMSAYYVIDKVTEVKTSTNKTALLVEMLDGGLGASYVAVVDPARGEVFFRRWAKVVSRRGDNVVLGHYKETDWEKFQENENAAVTPARTERLNLNKVLRGRIIVNKPN